MAYFIGSCVDLSGIQISDMVDNNKEINYEDFIKIVPEKELAQFFPFYSWEEDDGGLRLKDDWAVGYYTSKYNGRDCIYISHSSIEYVWITE